MTFENSGFDETHFIIVYGGGENLQKLFLESDWLQFILERSDR